MSKPKALSRDHWEVDRGSITLISTIGQGNFGEVHRGTMAGGRDVAVKSLKPGSTNMSTRDFLQEATAMKQFHHPNIVALAGVCTQAVHHT